MLVPPDPGFLALRAGNDPGFAGGLLFTVVIPIFALAFWKSLFCRDFAFVARLLLPGIGRERNRNY